jgi:DNA-binding transcriptional LysR family regulator
MIGQMRYRYLKGNAMDLRQLRYAIAVANERNLTRAADRLGLHAPPLSRQIKAIEREIGAQLFRRRPRGVELTAAGHVFVDNARSVLLEVDRTLEATRRAARGEHGQLSIGYSSSVAFHPLVPSIIRKFRDAYPFVTTTLTESDPADLIDRMQKETIDIAFIRRLEPHAQRIDIHLLLEESTVVALPQGHALATGRRGRTAPLSLKALAQETFILYGDAKGALTMQSNAFVASCRSAGFTPRIGHIVPHISARLNLIAAGLGVAVVAASLQHINIEGLTFRALRGPPPIKAPLSLAFRRGDVSPVVRQFLKLAKSAR